MNEDISFPPPVPPRRARARQAGAGQPEIIVNDTLSGMDFAGQQPASGQNRARPRASARSRSSSGSFSAWKALESVFSVALLVATLFTLWTPANLFSNNFFDRMFQAMQSKPGVANLPTSTPSPRPRIGLVAGHWGNGEDSGAVCADGETEVALNLKIATAVQTILTKEGYDIDLLREFDPKLQEYRALALISIHNDSCDYVNEEATGFKVASAKSSIFPEKATRLTACLSQRYQAITGMSFHYGSVTRDMTDYHAFNEIHSDTTAAIIETGFMNLDREILFKRTDQVAEGVASGILCFVRNENVPQVPTVQP